MKIAFVQMCSGADPFENLLMVNDFVNEAHASGAELVCFPENVFYRGPKKTPQFDRLDICLSLNSKAQLEESNEFSKQLLEFAKEWPVGVSLGSVLELREDPLLPYNSHFFIYPFAERIVSYQKIHLFKFNGKDIFYEESKDVFPGTEIKSVEYSSLKIGLSICFDLRFPELFRHLVLKEGANILLVPAAFAWETGKDHWHALLRARAIENQAYVVAAAQWGEHVDSRGQRCVCFGEAVAYGPWGEVLFQASDKGDAVSYLIVDKDSQNHLRQRLPALSSAQLLK